MRIRINENFSCLSEKYLFSEIQARVDAYKGAHGEGEEIISLGIGDVSLPLPRVIARKMASASSKMSTERGFRGYGNTRGELFLRDAISNRYRSRGVSLSESEIFINDGAKSDLGNINDLLGDNDTVICDPVYPVYLDSSLISGRRVHLVSANESNSFMPTPEELPSEIRERPLVIYLCSPNNPTGSAMTRDVLEKWVSHSQKSGSLIIFDAAYEAFISSCELPHSIFEIEGARECAIEVCSFSKSAGFTGLRCGWTAISKENPLHKLWERRQATKFNGASYISQCGALESLSPIGAKKSAENVAYYMENAKLLTRFFNRKGFVLSGGENAPYLWIKCPENTSSWELFDLLLQSAQVVVTPGVGFGAGGEGYFRLSAFATRKNTLEAIHRLENVL